MKAKVYQYCQDLVFDRIEKIQKQIHGLNESLTSATKSSAGDKHETGRAMMQLELEKLGQHLLEAEGMQQALNRIDINVTSHRVHLGSLVKTDLNSYFIAISAGRYIADGISVFCISKNAPLAQLLMGKSVDDEIVLHNVRQRILQID